MSGPRRVLNQDEARIAGYNIALRELIQAAAYLRLDGELARLKKFLHEEPGKVDVNRRWHGHCYDHLADDAPQVKEILRTFHQRLGTLLDGGTPCD